MTTLAQRLGVARYDADGHYKAALLAFGGRDLARARAEIQMAIDLLPKHAEYHAAQGFFLLEDKDGANAKEALERALALNAYEMMANYGLGMIAYRDKNWEKAHRYFLQALAAQPARAETQYYLAMVNHRLGQNAEALQLMEAAASAFAAAGDGRERHCGAWTREFNKLLAAE